MKNHRPVKWYCETWQQWFWLLEGWPQKEAVRYFDKNKIPDIELSFQGKTIFHTSGAGPIIVWTAPSKSIAKRCAILAHECIHAAHVCLLRAGVTADFSNDENVTYLVTVLIRKALGEKGGP